MKYQGIIIFFLFLLKLASAAELAVIPYHTESVSRSIKVTEGNDYAKYVGIASAANTNVDLYQHYQLIRDLKTFGISTKSVLLEDDLELIARRRMLTYVISGTLYAVDDGYRSKSFLYSASRGSIIAKSDSTADSLGKLAEIEASKLFKFALSTRDLSQKKIDSAVIIDTSFNIAEEYNSFKEILLQHYQSIYSSYPGAYVYIQPFNSATLPAPLRSTNFAGFKNNISSLKVQGGNNNEVLRRVLLSLSTNMQWRRGSTRYALLISNSPVTNSSLVILPSNRAKVKQIEIHSITGGRIRGDSYTAFENVSSITGGSISQLVYHQMFYGAQNRESHFYYQSGRLFRSGRNFDGWEKGNFNSLEQIFVKNEEIDPYTIEKYYRTQLNGVVVERNNLENNMDYISKNILKKYTGAENRSLAGRVLFQQLSQTLWSDVSDQAVLEIMKKQSASGTNFILGVRIVRDNRSPYGYAFHPGMYKTGFTIDDIPEELLINLETLLKTPEYYAEEGFLDPPLYFVNVKVMEVKENRIEQDIRLN
jgi:hypothetical protein